MSTIMYKDQPVGGVPIDSALNSASTNAVQNKVITGEINEIKENIGDTSKISSIGDGTTSGAISELNGKMDGYKSTTTNSIGELSPNINTTMNTDALLVITITLAENRQYGGMTLKVNDLIVDSIGVLSTTNPSMSYTRNYKVKKGDVVYFGLNTVYGTSGNAKLYSLAN